MILKRDKKAEAVARRCSVKKVFLKKRLWYWCFPVNLTKFKNTFSYRIPPVAASEKVTRRLKTLEDDNITKQLLYMLTFLFLSLVLYLENNSGMKKYPLQGLDD